MTAQPQPTRNALVRLGYQRLNRSWAKVEILLGLVAAGAGLALMTAPVFEDTLLRAAAGVALFALGGYLALAGHRSHLYQSSNEHLALLVEILEERRPKPGDDVP